MTEEELRDRLFRTINLLHLEGWETETVVDAIIAHIKEAGWKSPEEVKQRMKDILSEHPLASEYESDARYTWPERWIKLMEYFN